MTIRFADGHEAVQSPLFGTDTAALAADNGDWVQLSPASPTAETLGRLRTAVESAGGKLLAVVPEALLWPGSLPRASRFIHVDVRRDHLRLTVLEGNERLAITTSHADKSISLANVEKRIVAGLADQFVRETRYDPLHSANAEAALRQTLAQTLASTATGQDALLHLAGEQITLAPPQLGAWCQPAWSAVTACARPHFTADSAILLSPSAALPNLARSLKASFGDRVHQIAAAESRAENALREWLQADLPDYGSWLLQTRPRPT